MTLSENWLQFFIGKNHQPGDLEVSYQEPGIYRQTYIVKKSFPVQLLDWLVNIFVSGCSQNMSES